MPRKNSPAQPVTPAPAPKPPMSPEEEKALRTASIYSLLDGMVKHGTERIEKLVTQFRTAETAQAIIGTARFGLGNLAEQQGYLDVVMEVQRIIAEGRERSIDDDGIFAEIKKQGQKYLYGVTRYGSFIQNSSNPVSNGIEEATMKGRCEAWHDALDYLTW